MRHGLCSTLVAMVVVGTALGGDDTQTELKRFQGDWQVVELVEDGKVIPREAIREWLPSGGRLEVIENAIIFTTPHDGQKHAKAFAIDPTQYPRGIEISTQRKKDGWGIYRFDEERLVVCFSDPEESERPDGFSAKAGSKRTLMVMERAPKQTEAAPKAEPAPPAQQTADGKTAKLPTDAELTAQLRGTWRHTDNAGALFVIFGSDGGFRTVRESPQIRLFQKVFVQTPVSSGKWEVRDGEVTFHVTSSVQARRVGAKYSFSIRTISDRDLIFVDYLGRLGQAAKVR